MSSQAIAKDGAGTRMSLYFLFLFFFPPEIKFWCQTRWLVGKHLYPQNIRAEIHKVELINIGYYASLVDFVPFRSIRAAGLEKHERSACSSLTPSYGIKQTCRVWIGERVQEKGRGRAFGVAPFGASYNLPLLTSEVSVAAVRRHRAGDRESVRGGKR